MSAVDFVKSPNFVTYADGRGRYSNGRKIEIQALHGNKNCRIGAEIVMLIVALFAAFLFGIVVGSGLEILVREHVPRA
jgi:hypothetical protein